MAFSGRCNIPLPMNSASWAGLSGKLRCAFSREMEGTEMEGMTKVSQRVTRDLSSCRWLILTTRCLSGDALSWSALTTRKYLKEIRWGCGSNLELSPALKDRVILFAQSCQLVEKCCATFSSQKISRYVYSRISYQFKVPCGMWF